MCSMAFLRVLASVPNDYCRQSHEVNVVRQIERMENIKVPKIIIIGGSGCGFGLCSPLIGDYFHMPVCNTGTNAGLGLLTHLNLCRDYVQKGDIVVVVPEYSHYKGQFYLGEVANLRVLSSVYPSGYKKFTLRQQLYLIQYVPTAYNNAKASRGVNFDDENCNPYSMKALNEFGDVECFESRQHQVTKDWSVAIWDGPKLQRRAIKVLQEYNQYCMERGATMLVFPPAFKAMDFDANKDFIHVIWESLEKAQLPIVSYPEQYRMADTLHYDTNYHLTYDGVIIRTKQLIKDMDSALRVSQN